MIRFIDRERELKFLEKRFKSKEAELKERAKNVGWNKDNRKEAYAIFAKSFKNKSI